MESEKKNEDEKDPRQIYLRNFKPHQPRVGKQYQAVIPECCPRNNKIENKNLRADSKSEEGVNNCNNGKEDVRKEIKKEIKKEVNKNNIKENTKIEKDVVKDKIENVIIGNKTHLDNENIENEEYVPNKKRKINEGNN